MLTFLRASRRKERTRRSTQHHIDLLDRLPQRLSLVQRHRIGIDVLSIQAEEAAHIRERGRVHIRGPFDTDARPARSQTRGTDIHGGTGNFYGDGVEIAEGHVNRECFQLAVRLLF